MKKPRKHYTPEEKVAILRRHLLEQDPVSKLCDELGLKPTVFYGGQKESFENGAVAFQPKARSDHQAGKDRIEYLEKKIQRKDRNSSTIVPPMAAPCDFSKFWPFSVQIVFRQNVGYPIGCG